MRQIDPKLREPNIDAGIDLYIYGRKFFHYDRKGLGDVRVDMGDGKPWVPVWDWMKDGKKFTPDQLRHFARFMYEEGRSAGMNEVYRQADEKGIKL